MRHTCEGMRKVESRGFSKEGQVGMMNRDRIVMEGVAGEGCSLHSEVPQVPAQKLLSRQFIPLLKGPGSLKQTRIRSVTHFAYVYSYGKQV